LVVILRGEFQLYSARHVHYGKRENRDWHHYSSAQLHTTGDVQFAGLTNDSTQTRVLVSDANGKLYYRNASSLAAADVLRSSLAINGPSKLKS